MEENTKQQSSPPASPSIERVIRAGEAVDQARKRADVEQRRRLVRHTLLTGSIVLGLLLVNLLVVFPLFQGGWTKFLGSAEGLTFQLVRFVGGHLSPFDWNGQVNFGSSTLLAGGPLLAYLLALFAKAFSSVELTTVYRVTAGLAYLLGTLTFYLFVRYLTRREFTAIVATLYLSIPPYLFLFFLPSSTRDALASVGPAPWRLVDFLLNGEAKHLLGLAILPLALLTFLHALRTGAFRYHVLAAVSIALTLLAKWGSWPIVLTFLLVILASELVLGRVGQKVRSAFWVTLLAYGLLAFWVNPHFLAAPIAAGESSISLTYLVGLVPLAFVLLPILATALFFAFDRKPRLQPLFVGGVGTALFLSVVIAWGGQRQALFSNPLEFLPEYNLLAAILVGVALTGLVSLVRRWAARRLEPRQVNVVVVSLIALVLGALLAGVTVQVKTLRQPLSPNPDVTRSVEWRVAEQVRTIAASGQPVRVLAAGSVASWLPALAPEVEVIGNVETARRMNPQLADALVRLEEGSAAETYDLLRSLRVTHVVVSGPASQVADPGFVHPEQFSNLTFLFPEAGVDGTTVYGIGLAGSLAPPLALSVDPAAFRALPKTLDLADGEAIRQYVQSLESNPTASTLTVNRPSTNEIVIDGITRETRGISLAVNYDSSWRIVEPRLTASLVRDPMGFIRIDIPENWVGPLRLVSGPTTADWTGYGATGLTLIALAVLSAPAVRRKFVGGAAKPAIQPGVLIPPKAGFVEMMVETPEVLARKHEEAKRYYREVEDFDWVAATDNFQGLDTFFHRNREELVLKLVERFGVGGKYLDAGCGTGLVLRKLPAGSIGLDINPRAIEKAKENAPKAAFVLADAEHIPFPDNMFQTVVCTEVLDRLPNPKRALAELKRILAPGGVLIGTVPRENPMWRLRYLSSYNPEAVPWHKEFKRPELEALLADFELLQLSPALSYMTWAFVSRKPTL